MTSGGACPPTTRFFGEAVAILAGDALLTEAFECLASLQACDRFPSDRIIEIIRIVVKASGYRGMVGGQMIDLECETRSVDLATVEYMHIHKTGAILAASLEIGAILAGGTAEQVSALKRYGHHFGLAFQITDDVLDVEGRCPTDGEEARLRRGQE